MSTIATSPKVSAEFAEADKIMQQAIATGNPLLVTQHINNLQKQVTVRGVAAAKMLWGLRDNWDLFKSAQNITEDWDDFASANTVNLQPETIRRYANMWEAVFVKSGLPDNLLALFMETPVKNLTLLTAAIREGSLESDELETVPLLEYSEIQDLVAKKRGDAGSEQRAKRITGVLVVKEGGSYPRGTLYATQNGERETIGYLQLDQETEFGQQFLERIINALKLQEVG